MPQQQKCRKPGRAKCRKQLVEKCNDDCPKQLHRPVFSWLLSTLSVFCWVCNSRHSVCKCSCCLYSMTPENCQKGYTNFVPSYVTDRRRAHKVYIKMLRITGRVNWAKNAVCSSVRLLKSPDISYQLHDYEFKMKVYANCPQIKFILNSFLTSIFTHKLAFTQFLLNLFWAWFDSFLKENYV